MEAALRQRLEALPPAARAEILRVLRLPDLERAEWIGEFWSYPQSRAFAEPLIDCEEDRTLRAVLIWMLRGGRPAVGACRMSATPFSVRLVQSRVGESQ